MIPPSDAPPSFDMDPATAEAWRERERRQRSVRLLMMFLLMLLLMDGEEQSNRRRNEPTLRRKKNSRKSLILDETVYNERRDQDEAIWNMAKTHPRFLQLVTMNGNINYESQAREWAEQFTAEDQEDAQLDEDGDKDQHTVLHYPWNATGFYRGEWIREELDDDEEVEVEPDNTKEENREDLKETQPQLMSPIDLERPMLDMLLERDELIGVFLLPPGIQVKVENFTAVKSEMAAGETAKQAVQARSLARSPFMRYSEFTAVVEEEDDQTFHLPLSKSTGRTAFQLYSRSIPSMKEISIVEGFVKLYDSNTVGYSTRRDILLRARGVLIHSIGRLSLVSNAAIGRASLVVSDKPRQKNKADITKESKQDDETEDSKRRRLTEALRGINSESKPKLLDQIRTDTMDLYPYDAIEENFDGWHSIASTSENEFEKFTSIIAMYENREWLHDMWTKLWITEQQPMPDKMIHRKLSESLSGKTELLLAKNGTIMGADNDDIDNRHDSSMPQSESGDPEASDESLALEMRRMQTKESSPNDAVNGVYAPVKKSKIIFPFPFVCDDKSETIRKAKSPASRRMPQREQMLEANAGHCEFEINLDVKELEWTMGDWKRLMTRSVQGAKSLHPSLHTSDPYETDQKDEGEETKDGSHMKRKHESDEKSKSEHPLLKPMQDQALVMLLTGTIHSPNCAFTSSLNATAIRTDWEHTTGKAINYSFYMMLTCLTQIVVLLRQLLHTQAQSAATRVSLLGIGWQTVLDALLCLAHVYLSLAMQPLFTAFASVAFFKLLIFCVIEMKYMAIIIQARNSTSGGQTSTELLRRQIAMLHIRFYVALVCAFIAFFYAGQKYRTIYVLALYSFWVPQIIQNVITEAKRPLHTSYIYGMSLTRLVAPLYIFAVPNNFLKEVYPDSPTNFVMCELLVVWVGIQAALLIGQGKYGARFMVPARFLPPKFDYNRPIPTSLMPTDGILEAPAPCLADDGRRSEPPLLTTDESTERTTIGTRNRTKKGKSKTKTEITSMTTESLNDDPPCATLDCVICCNGINVHNRRGYMLAPCDHIFHRECLVQWMDVKMECPVCRKELPAI